MSGDVIPLPIWEILKNSDGSRVELSQLDKGLDEVNKFPQIQVFVLLAEL